MRLVDLYRGGLSYRELWVLLNRLPQDSWTQTELRDSQPDHELAAPVTSQATVFGPWGLTNYQLANLTDAVHWLRYVTAKVAGGDPTPPDPTPRPGAKRMVRKQGLASVTYLNSLRAPRGA